MHLLRDLDGSERAPLMQFQGDATFMRAVFTYGIRTSPNVEARANKQLIYFVKALAGASEPVFYGSEIDSP